MFRMKVCDFSEHTGIMPNKHYNCFIHGKKSPNFTKHDTNFPNLAGTGTIHKMLGWGGGWTTQKKPLQNKLMTIQKKSCKKLGTVNGAVHSF